MDEDNSSREEIARRLIAQCWHDILAGQQHIEAAAAFLTRARTLLFPDDARSAKKSRKAHRKNGSSANSGSADSHPLAMNNGKFSRSPSRTLWGGMMKMKEKHFMKEKRLQPVARTGRDREALRAAK